MSEELFEAIKRDDRAAVEAARATDPTLAAAERDGVTPLLLAVYWRKPALARLIAAWKGTLSLYEAVALGDAARVRELVDADPSLVHAFAPDGFQPLGLAAFFGHEEIVAVLLARGADASTPSRNDMRVTPLNSAVAAGHSAIARTLVEAGADIHAKQRHGWTPLHAAAEHGDRDLVAFLLARGADPNAKTDAGMNAADYARSKGDESLARFIESRVKH